MNSLEIDDLKIYLDEVEKSFTSVREATNILDNKAYNLFRLCFVATITLFVFNFIIDKAVINSLLSGFVFALFYLYRAYKLDVYPSNGNRMEEILKEDSFYHKKEGLLIYLINDYQKKIECTIEKNFQKAKYIKDSIIIICMTLFLNMFLYLIFE